MPSMEQSRQMMPGGGQLYQKKGRFVKKCCEWRPLLPKDLGHDHTAEVDLILLAKLCVD